jgi:aminopeptidase N
MSARRFTVAASPWLACVFLALGFASSALTPTEAAGKLPDNVIPVHYRIELRPDLDRAMIAGSEVIDIEARETTDRIELNAVAMTIKRAGLDGEASQVAAVTLDADAQTAALAFPQPIAPGRHRLAIDFTARINTFGRGLFSIDYPTDAGRRRLIATHLEPADARRIFPCWDEPGIKASFETEVTVLETFTAVSNMPVTHEEPAGAGLKRISFAPTPPMSSYLFVLAAGELERTTGDADGVEIGVVTTIGKRERGRYALDSAIALLRYYVDYFGVRYPLPKLDLIALPGGSNGAMENWGGITFFETRVLFDPGSSSERLKRDIFVVLAHEMAHLWFGDLVTMAWWDDLWLNEGFASWMQSKVAEQLNPGWTIWLESSGAKDFAMAADARPTSHPIRQPVADESEAMVAFDTITYTKGQAFIRQLEAYLGEPAFRDGIRRYIALHAYGNATTADLWQALEAASGQPVAAIAAGYTEQSGVPLIRAETRCAGAQQQLHLVQERFVIHDPNALPRRWQVPIVIATAGRPQTSERYLLSEGVLDITAGACGEPILLNAGGLGYYRVQYDEPTRQALAASFARLAHADRVTLLADGWALVAAEKMPPDDYFALIESIPADDVRAVWQSANRAFERLDRLERGRPQRSILRAYARRILRPAFDRLDWERAPSERVGHALLRSDLIWALGGYGDSEILAEARRRYEAFRDVPASLDPELRGAVIHLAGRTADRAGGAGGESDDGVAMATGKGVG